MSNIKPQEALQLGINVLIDHGCEGCRFCEFPYTINSIISNDSNALIEFNNGEDVWNYVNELIDEVEYHNESTGSNVSKLTGIYDQLPFFVCINFWLNKDCQDEISKYLYCKETSTPSYSGTYGDTPSLWIDKYYTIKKALIEKENTIRNKIRKEKSHGNN